MTNEEKTKRRIELIRKRIDQGLTLTEAHELNLLDDCGSYVPWKDCKEHEKQYLYGSKCPNCME